MDQDSFRKLLQIPKSNADDTTSRKSLKKTTEPGQPAFKPRKVNRKQETNGKYRDRAAERRTGEGNDYAQVEAVLDDFEKRVADNEDKSVVEEQRRYLGGDSAHSVIVKGLDFALLEQNKARASHLTDDDDTLEQAFLDASKAKQVPRKRTREDLIRELKERRGGGVVGKDKTKNEVTLEEVKKTGKFKPIGFGGENEKKKMKDRTHEGRKKKRKIEGPSDKKGEEEMDDQSAKVEMPHSPPPPVSTSVAPTRLVPEPEPDSDLDIFVGVGKYEGIDLGDDDDEGAVQQNEGETTVALAGQWFAPEGSEIPPLPSQSPKLHLPASSQAHSPRPSTGEEDKGEETEHPQRLIPLVSSAVPSIKDLLAMDDAQDNKKKRKGKKKGGDEGVGEKKVKLSAETKAERDYKRLKSYSEKKGAGLSTSQ